MVIICIPVVLGTIPSTNGTDLCWVIQIKGPYGEVGNMWCHARCPTAAIIHPGTVVEGILYQIWIKGFHFGRSYPHIPVHSFWNIGRIVSKADTVRGFVHYKKCPYAIDSP